MSNLLADITPVYKVTLSVILFLRYEFPIHVYCSAFDYNNVLSSC